MTQGLWQGDEAGDAFLAMHLSVISRNAAKPHQGICLIWQDIFPANLLIFLNLSV